MIRLPVKNLWANCVLAHPLPNPQKPGEVLISSGRRLEDRVVKLLRRSGILSAWVEFRDTEYIRPCSGEALTKVYADLLKQVSFVYKKAVKGEESKEDFVSCRDNVLAAFQMLGPPGMVYSPVWEVAGKTAFGAFHAVNVMHLSLLLAIRMARKGSGLDSFGEVEAAQLGIGALFHDIGRARVKPVIFEKEIWDLSKQELNEFQEHASFGYKILAPHVGTISANIAYYHHDYFDGSGYPQSGEPSVASSACAEPAHVFSRIVALASDFDRMRYGQQYSVASAIEEIKCARAGKYMPEAVDALLEVIPPFPVGEMITVSSGHRAVVAEVNLDSAFQPKIFLLQMPDGSEIAAAQKQVLDLRNYPKVKVRVISGANVDYILPDNCSSGWEGVS